MQSGACGGDVAESVSCSSMTSTGAQPHLLIRQLIVSSALLPIIPASCSRLEAMHWPRSVACSTYVLKRHLHDSQPCHPLDSSLCLHSTAHGSGGSKPTPCMA